MLVAKGGPCAALLASPCAKGRHAVEFEVVLPGTIGCSFGMAAASAQFDAPPGERAQTIGLRQDGSVCRDGETAEDSDDRAGAPPALQGETDVSPTR